MTTITRDEWLAEVQRVMRARPKGDPGLTTRQWAGVMHVGWARASAIIEQMCRDGQMLAGWTPTTGRDGRHIRVPCYRPIAPKAAKRR